MLKANLVWGIVIVLFREPENLPIEQWRGLGQIDRIYTAILVQSPVEAVVEAFSQIKKVIYWEKDAYGKTVEFTQQRLSNVKPTQLRLIIFRFRGHLWTIVNDLPYFNDLTLQEAQALAKLLKTCLIYYIISDSSARIGYYFYAHGELMERLLIDEYGNAFQSQLRQLTLEGIDDPYIFTDSFLREQGIYVPELHFSDKVVNQSMILRCWGRSPAMERITFEHDDFDQFDYLILENQSS
jgi:hypothetical protein